MESSQVQRIFDFFDGLCVVRHLETGARHLYFHIYKTQLMFSRKTSQN